MVHSLCLVIGKLRDSTEYLLTDAVSTLPLLSYNSVELTETPLDNIVSSSSLCYMFFEVDSDFEFPSDFTYIWSEILILHKYTGDENSLSALVQRWGSSTGDALDIITDDLRDILVYKLKCSSRDIRRLFRDYLTQDRYLKLYCERDLSNKPYIQILRYKDSRQLNNLRVYCKTNKITLTCFDNSIVVLYGAGTTYKNTINVCKPIAEVTLGYFKRCICSYKDFTLSDIEYITKYTHFNKIIDLAVNFSIEKMTDTCFTYLSYLRELLGVAPDCILVLLSTIGVSEGYEKFTFYYNRV